MICLVVPASPVPHRTHVPGAEVLVDHVDCAILPLALAHDQSRVIVTLRSPPPPIPPCVHHLRVRQRETRRVRVSQKVRVFDSGVTAAGPSAAVARRLRPSPSSVTRFHSASRYDLIKTLEKIISRRAMAHARSPHRRPHRPHRRTRPAVVRRPSPRRRTVVHDHSESRYDLLETLEFYRVAARLLLLIWRTRDRSQRSTARVCRRSVRFRVATTVGIRRRVAI